MPRGRRWEGVLNSCGRDQTGWWWSRSSSTATPESALAGDSLRCLVPLAKRRPRHSDQLPPLHSTSCHLRPSGRQDQILCWVAIRLVIFYRLFYFVITWFSVAIFRWRSPFVWFKRSIGRDWIKLYLVFYVWGNPQTLCLKTTQSLKAHLSLLKQTCWQCNRRSDDIEFTDLRPKPTVIHIHLMKDSQERQHHILSLFIISFHFPSDLILPWNVMTVRIWSCVLLSKLHCTIG